MKTFPIPSSPAPSGGERPPPKERDDDDNDTSSYARGGFIKGEGSKMASYAEGGPVLGRTRDFLKEPVEFRDRDEGKRQSQDVVGDIADEDQKYGKSGAGAGKGIHAPPPGKGKGMKAVMPRK